MWHCTGQSSGHPKGLPEVPCCSRYPNRKGNEPKLIINNYYFVIGEVITTKSIDQKTTCLKWHDKRVVTMLSTFHNDEVIEKRRRTRRADEGTETVKKPKMVEDYNQHMGGVDRNDQLVKYYTYSHRLVLCKLLLTLLLVFIGRRSGGGGYFFICLNWLS